MNLTLSKLAAFAAAVAISSHLYATDATWTADINPDLNTPGNWVGGTVPTGIATFDSEYPFTNPGNGFSPVSFGLFIIDNIDFPHSASDFNINLLVSGALQFNGIGISGAHTDTFILGANLSSINTAQLYFTPDVSTSSASLGEAFIILINDSSSDITFLNAAQISFADSDISPVVPVTAGNVRYEIENRGLISGSNEAAQIFLKGSSFTVGNNFVLDLLNVEDGFIEGNSDTGQIVFDAGNQTANWTVGDNARFYITNGVLNPDASSSNDIHSYNNNVGQIVFDGKDGEAAFTVGDNALFVIVHQNDSSIENGSSGNDAGQMVFDGNSGTASFTAGDGADINLSILTGSWISGEGFDTGQIVVDGDGGTASFTAGKDCRLVMTSSSSAINTIYSGTDGNDAGQLVIDGNNGSASFSFGDNADIYLSNAFGSTIFSDSTTAGHDAGQIVVDGNKNDIGAPSASASFALGDNSKLYVINAPSCTITSYYNTGQLVVDGNNGTASATFGDNNTITFENDGDITNLQAGSIAAQIVFNGSTAGAGGVSLNSGTNTSITAILGVAGTITNAGALSPAQIYFSSAAVNGSPTLKAVNLSAAPVEGIVFDGTSTATEANIALQNSTLLIDTTGHPLFTIGSLAGDGTSLVKLNQDLEIHTPSGSQTTFAGVIYDASGVNNLFISGSGIQELSGVNTFGGNTTINGGNLLLTGSVANDVIVNSGGTLSGTGTVNGNVIVNANGTVKPGLDPGIGTLHVGQNYSQDPLGIFYVQITGAPASSLLQITGAATLAGTLQVASADGTYSIGRPYTVLTAGTMSGTFNQVTAVNPFLNVDVIYDPDPSVQIILSTDFASGAETGNEKRVAEQIDGIALPVGFEEMIINNLLALTPDQLPKALDEMAGEQYSYLVQINQFSDFRFGRRIFDNVRNFLDPCYCRCCCCGINTWAAFETEYGHMVNTHKSRGYKERSYDLSFGADVANGCTLFGAALNLESSEINFNLKGTNKLKNIQGAVYGALTCPDYYVFSDLIIGQGTSHFKRCIQFADLAERARSSPEFTHGLLYGEAGLNLCWCDILVQPFIGADCSYVNAHGFHERHAESLNLRVKGRTVWSEDLYLGTHLSTCCDCVELNADLIYQHRFGNLGTTLHNKFIDFGDEFAVKGAQYSRDGFIGNINAMVSICDLVDTYVEFTTELWGHRYTYAGSVGISCCW